MVGKTYIIMKKILLILVSSILFTNAFTQSKLITAGVIEFERKFNQFTSLNDETKEGEAENGWVEMMKKTVSKIVTDMYVLYFNETQSVYKLKNENTENKYMWGLKPAETDVLVKNIASKQMQMQREVFEKNYLITDSLRKYEWKITNEIREIAGYDCKKAITKICDSVYVVAYYTEDIMVSNGPENFYGLPGMILGIAVPRLATTWFASKVEAKEPTNIELTPKLKGTKSTYPAAIKEMLNAMKDWGKYGYKRVWSFML